jgi:hypothetical protein
MRDEKLNIDHHVGEYLSGYIDGELTQQQRQRLEIHCDHCPACTGELADLAKLRADVGASSLSQYGSDMWGESMRDTTAQTARGIGWLLFLGGVLAAGGIGIFAFITDPDIKWHFKLIAVAIYGGLALLFISVVRQRYVEQKTDRYKDVEI